MSYRIYTELDKIMKLNLLLYVSDKVDYFRTYRRMILFIFHILYLDNSLISS